MYIFSMRIFVDGFIVKPVLNGQRGAHTEPQTYEVYFKLFTGSYASSRPEQKYFIHANSLRFRLCFILEKVLLYIDAR